MNDQNFKTDFPEHIPLSSRNWRPGEKALTSSALFHKHGLSLYRGVMRWDLDYADGSDPWENDYRDIIDYLICKDDGVIMAIEVADRDEWWGPLMRVNDLHYVETSAEQMECGEVDHILAQLDERLRAGDEVIWKCRVQELPEVWYERLEDGQLLEFWDGAPEPTEYGICQGLVKAVCPERRTTMCSRTTLDRIEAMLDSHKKESVFTKQIPFYQRLEACRAGLYCNSANSAKLVQKMRDVPLEEYMDSFPGELQTLQSGALWPCRTYGEIAPMIYGMLQSGDVPTFDNGVKMLKALSAPLVNFGQVSTVVLSASSPATGRSTPARQRRSFAERVGQQKSGFSAMSLSSVPLKIFFQGVDTLAGTGYPLWLADTLSIMYEYSGTYAGILRHADQLYGEEAHMQEGLYLLYLLLIEPFQLIHHTSTATKRKD